MKKAEKLSDTEKLVLDTIIANPGLVPAEIHELTKGGTSNKASSIAGITSTLIKKKRVNRVKVPFSTAFRYYAVGVPLPEGKDYWDNTIIHKTVHREPKKPNGATPPPAEIVVKPQMVLPLLPEPKRKGVLVVIEVGNNDTMEFTTEQARSVYTQLQELFG